MDLQKVAFEKMLGDVLKKLQKRIETVKKLKELCGEYNSNLTLLDPDTLIVRLKKTIPDLFSEANQKEIGAILRKNGFKVHSELKEYFHNKISANYEKEEANQLADIVTNFTLETLSDVDPEEYGRYLQQQLLQEVRESQQQSSEFMVSVTNSSEEIRESLADASKSIEKLIESNSELKDSFKRLFQLLRTQESDDGLQKSNSKKSTLNDDALDSFASLVIDFLDETHLSSESSLDFFKDDKRVTRIFSMANDIKSRVLRGNTIADRLIDIVEERVDSYCECRELCLCIRDCGELLGNNTINEEVLSNAHFLEFFSRYAKKNGHEIHINECIGNLDLTLEAFVKVLGSPEGKEKFLDEVFYGPDKIIYRMQQSKKNALDVLHEYIKQFN